MLTIPVKLDLDAGAAETALKNFEKGAKDALDEIVSLDGKKINIDFKFSMSGEPVVKELTDQEAALKKTTNAYNRLSGGQAESIGRTKKVIAQFKKQRDELAVNSKEYKIAAATVRKFEERLRVLQGVQKGSTADLKVKRANLVALQANLKINSAEYNRLTAEIAKYDAVLKRNNGEVKKATKNNIGFFNAFAKIAVVSAGLNSINAALRSVGNAIDVYVRRTKEVEGFNLALENIGLTQAEANATFKQARNTALALGAPLAQVEKTYKRMIPSLRGVGATAEEADKFIEAITARTQTLGLNTEQSGRLLEAFAQVLSKGKLQAEELNQQISELDGAFRTQLADALGVTTAELTEMISNSEVTSQVFVKAVTEMANGVDALRSRVAEGNLTIQQLQNNISTIDTINIENIGKAIEPAIRSFLSLRQAFADFIREFTNTSVFDFLVITFNGIAKGIELFVKGLLNAISAVNSVLSVFAPLANLILSIGENFGGLVGILTQVTIAFGLTTAAVLLYKKALNMKQTIAEFIVNNAKQVASMKSTIATAAKFAVPIALAVGGIQLLSSTMANATKDGKEFDESLKNLDETMKELGATGPDVTKMLLDFVNVFNPLKQGLDLLANTSAGAQISEQMTRVKHASVNAQNAIKKLGISTDDLSTFNNVNTESIKNLLAMEKEREKTMNTGISTAERRLKIFEREGKFGLAQKTQLQIKRLKEEQAVNKENIAVFEDVLRSRGESVKILEQETDAIQENAQATKQALEVNSVAAINAKTEAIKKYGQEANAANLLAAANVGIAQAESEANLAALEKELQQIQKNAAGKKTLDEEEQKRASQLTQLIAQERQTQAELGMQAQELINNALEDGITKAQEFGEISGGASQRLVGAFDGLAGSVSSALGSAMSLVDQMVAHEIKGLDKGDRKRQQIILRQLRGQAKVNAVENTIAQLKLKTQHMMEVSEARILGMRLKAEAEVARARGQTGLADELEKVAGFQGVIIQSLQQQYQFNKQGLEFEKQKKSFALIQKALGEDITNNQGKAARLIGVQNTSLNQAFKSMEGLAEKSEDFEGILLDSAEATQNMKEDANKFALKDGQTQAEAVRKALQDSEIATQDLGGNIDTFKGSLDNAAASAERMKGELQDSVDFARQLSQIVANGTAARALGGPVQGGSTYLVNDGGGREGFLSNSGKFSMLPAARNINWTAPTSGTVIPANMVGQYQRSLTAKPEIAPAANLQPSFRGPDKVSANLDSGSLVQRMAAVMSGNSGDQRITNHVTIQSQEPVTDASKIMTNVARMRLRKGGRF